MEQSQKPSFFVRLATFIVDKRNLFFFIYAVLVAFSIVARDWVTINDDITDYLPEDTETRQGLTVMEEQFVTYGTARVMVSNITYETAARLAEEIGNVESVASAEFVDEPDGDSEKALNLDDLTDHYRSSSALFNVSFDGKEDDPESVVALAEIQSLLADYDVSISTDVGVDDVAALQDEIRGVMLIAAFIIVGVLLLTSKTYAEIPVMLITFLVSMLLNIGTNFIFGTISYVSNSVGSILQLALGIDYAIIFCHRFSEERTRHNAREACILALSASIPEISSSCLTTLAGLTAMMFMRFRIGFDMGCVLLKAILISILTVFLLMPGLLMLFSDLMDKSRHRSFIPKVSVLGKIAAKLKYVVPPGFVAVVAAACILSGNTPFGYGETLIETVNIGESRAQEDAINAVFGDVNSLAVTVPGSDYETEGALLDALERMEAVDSVTGLANVEVEDGYMLTDAVTPRQFAEMMDMDVEVLRLLYIAYAANQGEYGRILNNIDSYKVPILDMFLFLYDEVEKGTVTLDDGDQADLDDLYEQITRARNQLQGTDYSRLVLTVNLPEEGDETFAFLDDLHDLIDDYYPKGGYFVTGDSTSDYEFAETFARDNTMVSVMSIVLVIIVLLFTFKSVGMPVLLILVIQGSIWINFAVLTLTQSYVFFMSYLVVSSIQMGANIDYAIVISTRYQELKHEMPPEKAIIESLNLGFPTVLTSGVILASAGLLIATLTSDSTIYGVGDCLGRGTIISMILVLGVLPEILLLGDKIIEKTAFNLKYPMLIQTVSTGGRVHLDGHIRGMVNGRIDAEVHGYVEGEVTALVDIHHATELHVETEEEV